MTPQPTTSADLIARAEDFQRVALRNAGVRRRRPINGPDEGAKKR